MLNPFPVWIHGAPDCSQTADPSIQVHQYDADTFILRQSKCSEPGTPQHPGPSFEAPFLYLIFGDERALLLDTGASRSPTVFPIGQTVREIIDRWLADRNRDRIPLVVCHSHSHDDHAAGDHQFQGMSSVTVVPFGVPAVKQFFGIPGWPDQVAPFELGGRTLDVIPIPGHETTHIALYDRNPKLLLTGDSLYPGLLVVNDWDAYRKSIARLKAFADTREIAFILGAHVEMTNQPGRWFGLGTLFQPGEHILQLEARHLDELNDAVQAMGSHPRIDRHADFIIFPANQPLPPLHP